MQKIEVEEIVVFENVLAAALVLQKINFCCLQRLRYSLGDIYILQEEVILSFKNCFANFIANYVA